MIDVFDQKATKIFVHSPIVNSLTFVWRSSINVAIHLSFSCQLNFEISNIHPSPTIYYTNELLLQWFEMMSCSK